MPGGAVHDSRVQLVFRVKHNRGLERLFWQQEATHNMKKTLAAFAIVALSATLAVAGPGEGRGFHGGKHHRGAGFSGKLAEKLNLTDAQKQQIAALENRFKAEQKTFFDANKATFEQFREARKADDTAKIEALKPQMEALREQMKATREAQHNQILSVLTAEQKAQLEALKAQRKSGKRNRTE
jgi:Spy/CpxP family protein refolding chaperone